MVGCHNNINYLTWSGLFPILFKCLGGVWDKRQVLKLPELQKLTGDDGFHRAWRVTAAVHLCVQFSFVRTWNKPALEMKRLMLCNWHIHCISRQLLSSPILLLRPPANTLYFYHCVICSAIWSRGNVTFELAQTLNTHKNTFFFSPQEVRGCNNYSPDGSLKLSRVWKEK